MNEWMTIKDLSEYLQIPESKIKTLISKKEIPFYNKSGILRFNRQEIDTWMKTPPTGNNEDAEGKGIEDSMYKYRRRPINDYKLTASKILMAKSAWVSLPAFIKQAVEETRKKERNYLYRAEFENFLSNFNDYLRISCQLGLIENVRMKEEDQRKKRYYVTDYANHIYETSDINDIKKIILKSILVLVKAHKDITPDEKHAILNLWLYLKIKSSGKTPEENDFIVKTDNQNNYYPSIRLGFAKSFCSFLFSGDDNNERQFLAELESNLN